MTARLSVVGERGHSDVPTPVPETVTDADGNPVKSRELVATYPLAAECVICSARIELPDRGVFTDWQHVDGTPPPRRPPVPPPRAVR